MNSFLYEKIWSSIPYPAIVVNSSLKIISANSSTESYFSTSIKKMELKNLSFFLGENSLISDAIKQFQNLSTLKVLYDLNIYWSNKKMLKCDVFISSIENESKNILILFHPKSEANLSENKKSKSAARSLSGISSMFSHEIRNPLAGISGATELLSSEVGEKDIELINVIKYDIERIKNLVDRIETLGQYEMLQLEELNIHDVLENSKKSASVSFASKINIFTEYDPSLPNVLGDKNQLFQVTQNLLKNASEAINPEKGLIKISTSFIQGSRLFANSKTKENLSLKVTISDNGVGVNENIVNDIFDPFVSTKKSGSGLGLAIVSRIVESHGGLIKYNYEKGWSNFSFFLPVIYKNKV